jgi:hypothetical protein
MCIVSSRISMNILLVVAWWSPSNVRVSSYLDRRRRGELVAVPGTTYDRRFVISSKSSWRPHAFGYDVREPMLSSCLLSEPKLARVLDCKRTRAAKRCSSTVRDTTPPSVESSLGSGPRSLRSLSRTLPCTVDNVVESQANRYLSNSFDT